MRQAGHYWAELKKGAGLVVLVYYHPKMDWFIGLGHSKKYGAKDFEWISDNPIPEPTIIKKDN